MWENSNITGFNILDLLNRRSGLSWSALKQTIYEARIGRHDVIGLILRPKDEAVDMMLYNCLRQLASADFIKVDGVKPEAVSDYLGECLGGYGESDRRKIRASDKWIDIFQLISTPWSTLSSSLQAKTSLNVSPIFGLPNMYVKSELFVIMPFKEDLKLIYTNHIIPVASTLNLSIAHADDLFTERSVISDIWSAIWNSSLVIADCTNRNPNVFYELGLAHTIGKPVILLAQTDGDVPFDLRHMRYIMYTPTDNGLRTLALELTYAIKNILHI